MARELLLLTIFIISNTDVVDVNVLGLAFLSVDGLYFLLEIQKSLVVLSKTVVDITSNSMPISSIASTIISFISLSRLLRRLRSLFLSLTLALPFIDVIIVLKSSFCRHFIQTFTGLSQLCLCLLRIQRSFLTPIVIDVLFQYRIFILTTQLDLSHGLHICQFSVVKILCQLSLYPFPSVFQVQFCTFSKIQSRCVSLICFRFVIQSMRLDVVSFHKVTIANTSTFYIFTSVCLRAGTLIKFSEGRVRECASEGNLILNILLNGLSFQFLKLTLFLNGYFILLFSWQHYRPGFPSIQRSIELLLFFISISVVIPRKLKTHLFVFIIIAFLSRRIIFVLLLRISLKSLLMIVGNG